MIDCKWWSANKENAKLGNCKLGKFGGAPAAYHCQRHCAIYNGMRLEVVARNGMASEEGPLQVTVNGAAVSVPRPKAKPCGPCARARRKAKAG